MEIQAPNIKSQTNTNDQNSKFKIGAIVAEHLLSDRNVSVIVILDLDIIWNLWVEILGSFSEKQIIFISVRVYFDITLLAYIRHLYYAHLYCKKRFWHNNTGGNLQEKNDNFAGLRRR